MDINELIRKLEKAQPAAILEVRPFGHSEEPSIWIEMKAVHEVCSFIHGYAATALDWLENIGIMEIDQALVVSYFLRSRETDARLVVRGSVMPDSPESEVEVRSVSGIWPMAREMELEASELWGIRFAGNELAKSNLLPEDWVGFPLRKNYSFPNEVNGVMHFRPAGRTAPDEYGVQP